LTATIPTPTLETTAPMPDLTITPAPAARVPRRARPVTIYDLTFDALEAKIVELGAPQYRAKQIWDWVYGTQVTGWDEMRNLPTDLRETLAEAIPFSTMRLIRESVTDDGDTHKLLYQTFDGQFVETVLMLYPDRATVCVSCQVGCAVGCAFCATGLGGLTRSLTAGEMVQQTVDAARQARGVGRQLTNLVMMGMGEPLQTYAPTMAFIGIINDARGLGFGARRITISTSGIVPGIQKLTEEPYQVNLAVSLHAPNDELRSSLVPVNDRWPIPVLLDAVDAYTAKTGRRVSFEYALMKGINSSDEIARELGHLLKGRLCHVNVIPFNPVDVLEFERPDHETIERFAEIVREAGDIPVTVRYSRGVEIDAACGQLRARHEREQQAS
jgi:23S rRNA (adenine2503-C2)-methyltransferase